MGGIGIVVIMPIGIYYLIRYRYFSKTEWTDIQEVKLERIYTPWPRILGFEVPMNFGGQSRIVRTFALFTAEWIGPNKVKNYSGQTVRVGYDAAKDKAVVLDTPVVGWYYIGADNRTASWTGVEYLYRFLADNKGAGPFAKEVPLGELEIGDLVQFGRATGDFYHTPVVCGFSRGEPLVAAHSYDAFNKSLSSYSYQRIRCLHILGVRRP